MKRCEAGLSGGAEHRASRRRRLGWLAAVVVAASLALAGCGGVLGSLVATRNALHDAGFGSAKVNVDTSNDVSVSVHVAAAPTKADVIDVGGIVWHDVHQRFDVVTIAVHGTGGTLSASPTFDELQSYFGARDPAYNRTDVTTGLEDFGLVAVVVVLAVLAVLAAVVIAVVVVVRRRRGGGPARPGDWGAPPGAGSWSSTPTAPPPWMPPPPGWAPPGSAPDKAPAGPAAGGWGPPTGA